MISAPLTFPRSLDTDVNPRHLTVVQPLTPSPQLALFQAAVENFVDGIVIVTVYSQMILSNQTARTLLQDLPEPEPATATWVRQLCQSLSESRHRFPHERAIPELELTSRSGTTIRVRAQWLAPQTHSDQHVLLTLENRSQSFHNLAVADAQKYGLTARETEVWELRRAGFSYRDIATKLYITHNTVKRHVKNILAKQGESA